MAPERLHGCLWVPFILGSFSTAGAHRVVTVTLVVFFSVTWFLGVLGGQESSRKEEAIPFWKSRGMNCRGGAKDTLLRGLDAK